MYRKAVRDEAALLIQDYGASAYDTARAAMREAHRRRNDRREQFMAKVALEVARRKDRKVGMDTATRYLE
jgi:hypothetical protein